MSRGTWLVPSRSLSLIRKSPRPNLPGDWSLRTTGKERRRRWHPGGSACTTKVNALPGALGGCGKGVRGGDRPVAGAATMVVISGIGRKAVQHDLGRSVRGEGVPGSDP